MWKKILAAGIGIGIAGTALAQVPMVPYQDKWVVSYETLAFNTPDGDLDFGQYAVDPDNPNEFYVRVVPKSVGQFEGTTSPDAIKGFTQVQVVGKAYYDEFQLKDGTINRVQSQQTKYDALRFTRNAPQPSKAELVPITTSLGASAAITFDATSTVLGNAVSSISWSHTVSGSNSLLTINCANRNTILLNRTITSVTYNSINATKATSTDNTSSKRTEIWYKVAPSSGSNTVVVSYGATVGDTSCEGLSLDGAAQSGQPDVINGTSTTATTIKNMDATTTTLTANDWMVDVVSITSGSGGSPINCNSPNANNNTSYPLYNSSQTARACVGDANNIDGVFSSMGPVSIGTFGTGFNAGTASTWAYSVVYFAPAVSASTFHSSGYIQKASGYIKKASGYIN